MTDVAQIQMLDIARPDEIEITFSPDHQKLWINIDGICRLRVTGIAVAVAWERMNEELTRGDRDAH